MTEWYIGTYQKDLQISWIVINNAHFSLQVWYIHKTREEPLGRDT